MTREALGLALSALVTCCCLCVRAEMPAARDTTEKAPSSATDARVVIVTPDTQSALLEEALIRTRGELLAVGLAVEMRHGDDAVPFEWTPGASIYGALVFEVSGSSIRISAFAPGLEAPVVQIADTSVEGIDAEVIAIRGVETLRAAVLQYARRARGQRRALPESVLDFTRLQKTEAEATPRAAAPRKPSIRNETDAFRFTAWLGPSIVVEPESLTTSSGTRVAAFAGRRWYYAGIGGDAAWTAPSLAEEEGSASLRRIAVALQLRAQFELVADIVAFGQIGAGMAHYFVEVTGSGHGYTGRDREHWSPRGTLELGGAYWPSGPLGAYLSLGAALASDAPSVRFAEREVARFDQPALLAGLGLIIGQR